MPIYKTSKGWMYKCSINGHQYTKSGFKTKKEAELNEAAFKLNFNEFKSLKNIKIALALKNYYLNLKDHRSKCTFYHEQLKLRKYVLDYFGNIYLSELTHSRIMEWYYMVNKLSVTLSYKNHLLNSLRGFCKYLKLYYGFDYSMIERLYPFSDYSIKTIDLDESTKYLSLDEFKEIFTSDIDNYWKLYISLSFFLGLRIGELKALVNNDNCFNTKHKALLIYKQLVYAGAGKPVEAKTKSKTSDRVYYLPDFIFNMLVEHIKSNNLKVNDYIFFSCNDKKKPISSTTIRRKLNNIAVNLNPHKFRHSSATNLFAAGVNKEDLKNFLGHSNSKVTMNVYVHKTREEIERVNNVLEIIYQKIKE